MRVCSPFLIWHWSQRSVVIRTFLPIATARVSGALYSSYKRLPREKGLTSISDSPHDPQLKYPRVDGWGYLRQRKRPRLRNTTVYTTTTIPYLYTLLSFTCILTTAPHNNKSPSQPPSQTFTTTSLMEYAVREEKSIYIPPSPAPKRSPRSANRFPIAHDQLAPAPFV